MFDFRGKPDKSGDIRVEVRLHAATKRKLAFVNDFVDTLALAYPAAAKHCEQARDAIAGILLTVGEKAPSEDKPQEKANSDV